MNKEFEKAVKENGFKDVAEFQELVSSLDLTLPGMAAQFEAWKRVDGTKKGLLNIYVEKRADKKKKWFISMEDNLMDKFTETHLPWCVNNGLRWLTQIMFLPLVLLLFIVSVLTRPFTRDFYDGSLTLGWGWECLRGDDDSD